MMTWDVRLGEFGAPSRTVEVLPKHHHQILFSQET